MLLTCRSIVRSLRTSSSAIPLLVWPAATRRRTSSSRGVRPCVSGAGAWRVPGTRAGGDEGAAGGARGARLVGCGGWEARALEPSEIRRRAESLEDATRRLELERRCLLVAERAA